MARKRNEDEQVTDANIQKVIALLGQAKPITKKAACELLNISYNTTRLDAIIREYETRQAYEREQREKKRYKAATQAEIDFIITSSLEGRPISSISHSLYRSDSFVKNIIERFSCPRRLPNADYWNPEPVPEAAQRESFKPGERVWSTRYNSLAEIRGEYDKNPGVYRIWLLAEEWQQFAYQPYWELASLEHLREQGITI